MGVTYTDRSDNNPFVATFPGDGVALKFYPPGSPGWGWLVHQYDLAKKWADAHPGFMVWFYAADSTPTLAAVKAAAAALGIDLNTVAFAYDLREFGYSQAYVKNLIAATHADGQVKVGHYWRLDEADGQDWQWPANYVRDPGFGDLHQYTDTPVDTSRSRDPNMTPAGFAALTTKPQNGGGFLDTLTPAQQQEVYGRALETGADLAGQKLRKDIQTSATIRLTDGSTLVVTKASTQADFGADLGLWHAFQNGLTA